MTPAVERAIRALRILPGVGKKTATRFVYALLAAPNDRVEEIAAGLRALHDQVVTCSRCFNWTEEDPCEICTRRADSDRICVVEHPLDVQALQKTGRYRDLFHVLHGTLDPMHGVTLDDLTIDALVTRVRSEEISEVLLALSPTREGEATCRLIATLLADTSVRLTRLAYGLPLGTQLEYLDEGTLSLALDHRRNFPDGPDTPA